MKDFLVTLFIVVILIAAAMLTACSTEVYDDNIVVDKYITYPCHKEPAYKVDVWNAKGFKGIHTFNVDSVTWDKIKIGQAWEY